MRSLAPAFGLALAVAASVSCTRERRLCKVNDQCFVCADERQKAKCLRDPSTSRCTWTPPSECK